ncbi:MAG: hypothetical protein RL607_579 [Bacteroidota bacterium]|jgi:hypothetical protein
MKKILLFVVIHWAVLTVAQPMITPMPEGTQEIHFVYEQKAKVYMDDSGIYMDTLMMKVYYPKVRFVVKQHPKNTNLQWAFSQSKSFSKEELDHLKSLIYHSNEKFIGVYSIQNKKTTINAERNDLEAKDFFNKIFRERYQSFYYSITNDFKLEKQYKKFPSVNYDFTFKQVRHQITFNNEPLIGSYTGESNGIQFKNIVYLNPLLPKEISIDIFDAKFGIERIDNFDRTLELTAITYKN